MKFTTTYLLILLVFGGCASTSNTQSYIPPSEMKETAQLVITREEGFIYSGLSANGPLSDHPALFIELSVSS